MGLDQQLIRALPKVALHEHLDGALRPATVVELAAEDGHQLPTTDPDALGRWFFDAADSGSLVRYLETFEHTLACMQTREHLVRVTREFVEDSASDGIVYVEARWAPEQHLRGGLSLADAVEAVRDGLVEGMDAAASAGRPLVAQQIVSSMRHLPPRRDVAELAVIYRDDTVCGFDIAGPEAGFPPSLQASTFDFLRRSNVPYTIHAGEAAGVESIWEAVQLCGANRLGHGVRLLEDADGGRLGRVAQYVLDRQLPLEVCPTSNLQTGVCSSVADHPIGRLAALGFNVTVSCDNRLMSSTTLSRELALASDACGWGLDDLRRLTLNAARSAFYRYDKRERLIADVILPGFERAGVATSS
ncbi:MAG TPA: adenosine deaminase [Propioniciclava tarda]|nr:adenosine deaminase [Propioniciclava tarda]